MSASSSQPDRDTKLRNIVRIEPGAKGDPISSALQRLHHSVIEEEVPDSFHDLVAMIGAKIESPKK